MADLTFNARHVLRKLLSLKGKGHKCVNDIELRAMEELLSHGLVWEDYGQMWFLTSRGEETKLTYLR